MLSLYCAIQVFRMYLHNITFTKETINQFGFPSAHLDILGFLLRAAHPCPDVSAKVMPDLRHSACCCYRTERICGVFLSSLSWLSSASFPRLPLLGRTFQLHSVFVISLAFHWVYSEHTGGGITFEIRVVLL